jgi:glucose/mannose transport system permease protein
VSIAIASVNGYALANWRFKGADIFFTILIFGSFIPYQVMLYPRHHAARGSTARSGG